VSQHLKTPGSTDAVAPDTLQRYLAVQPAWIQRRLMPMRVPSVSAQV